MKSLSAAEYRKIPCPLCQGNIEFPTEALGQLAPCPHCAQEIVLEAVQSIELPARRRGHPTHGWWVSFVIVFASIIGLWFVLGFVFWAIFSKDPLGEVIGPLALFLLAALVYFIPSIVAKHRKARNCEGIFLLNLFLGWTLLGWVGALIWAHWEEKP